ncbi:hypothetical protein FAIPA1_40109 [Frankia sp. AiPs1]
MPASAADPNVWSAVAPPLRGATASGYGTPGRLVPQDQCGHLEAADEAVAADGAVAASQARADTPCTVVTPEAMLGPFLEKTAIT